MIRSPELRRGLAGSARHLAVAVGVPLLFLAILHLWPSPSLVRVEAVSEVVEITSEREKETWWWLVGTAATTVAADGSLRPLPLGEGSGGPRPLAFRGSVRLGLEGGRDGRVSLELALPERCRPTARRPDGPACRPGVVLLDGRRVELEAETLVLELAGGPSSPRLAFAGSVVLGRLAGDDRAAPPRLLRQGRVAILAHGLLGGSVHEAGARDLLPGDQVRFLAEGGREAVGDGLVGLRADGAIELVLHAAAAATRVARAELEPVQFRASVYSRLAYDPFLQGLAALFMTAWGAAVGRLLERPERGRGDGPPASAGDSPPSPR